MVLASFIDIFLHLDKYLGELIVNFGSMTYVILFAIIFLETGIVITHFLPGDSLLFIVGAFAAQGALNIYLVFLILTLAAIIGDSVNYAIGNYFGESFFEKKKWVKKEYLERTKKFYEKHGGMTIFMCRFIPIIRTIAPFVAGVGKMNYKKFLFYNVFGGIVWVATFLTAGYFFGTIPFIKENLSWIIVGIVLLSVVPVATEYFWHKKRNKYNKSSV